MKKMKCNVASCKEMTDHNYVVIAAGGDTLYPLCSKHTTEFINEHKKSRVAFTKWLTEKNQ